MTLPLPSFVVETNDKSTGPGELLPGFRRFDFGADTFAFPNELFWEYRFDVAAGETHFRPRVPRPEYAHRCFVLVRAARQFQFHARFDASQPPGTEKSERDAIVAIVSRNPRHPSSDDAKIPIPGYANLRQFSEHREALLKAECGGAWRSYALRSHWRMVFPISARHQRRTAAELRTRIARVGSAAVHLVRFPSLTINHGMLVFESRETAAGWEFSAYDPNNPERPVQLSFSSRDGSFSFSANHYWPGGKVQIIEIFKGWLY